MGHYLAIVYDQNSNEWWQYDDISCSCKKLCLNYTYSSRQNGDPWPILLRLTGRTRPCDLDVFRPPESESEN